MRLIESGYRKRFIFQVCAYFLLTITVGALCLYVFLDRPFDQGYLAALSSLDQLRHKLLWAVLATVLTQLVVFSVLVFFVSLFWTHKIAGPLFRLKKTFARIASGDLVPMTGLRQRDQLKNIPWLLNQCLKTLEEQRSRLRADIVPLEKEIARQAETGLDADRLREVSGQIGLVLKEHENPEPPKDEHRTSNVQHRTLNGKE
ncbi:MAG: hypothetical protein AVO38_13730 [delta proteobacterium ML8_D]|jgi:hypothetical protein|nr:MAG: hypothetical protein AVO34_10230 [Firmicutes bacterium ML8_F2]OPL13283.1 MAG: hypothetical protein AVO38_13730 [delta proteobacterium ML8_D]